MVCEVGVVRGRDKSVLIFNEHPTGTVMNGPPSLIAPTISAIRRGFLY
jgi:hypothetical protein